LLGGRDKNLDFTSLAALISERGDVPLIYGEAREKISRAFGAYQYFLAKNFRQAVELAIKKAKTGDTVLLSPAASSYDEFSNFEERGNLFKSLIIERI
jgi:UDP-N-acetylmuramoylalanine--D-glutamate ligase